MKTILIIASFLVFSAGLVRNSLPAWTAFAKSDSAPGQANKTLNAQGNNENGRGNSDNPNKNTNAGKLKKQALPTLIMTQPENAKVKQFLQNKTTGKPLEKIGPSKIREYLLLEGTGSAILKKVKFEKLNVREATPGAQLKRHAVQGIITDVGDGVVIISHQIQSERAWTIYYNAATVVRMKGNDSATGADLTVGMRIAAVGEPFDGGGLMAKRIHVIPGRATGVFNKQPEASDGGDLDLSPTPVSTVTATPVVSPEATPTAVPDVSPTPTSEPEPTPTPAP